MSRDVSVNDQADAVRPVTAGSSGDHDAFSEYRATALADLHQMDCAMLAGQALDDEDDRPQLVPKGTIKPDASYATTMTELVRELRTTVKDEDREKICKKIAAVLEKAYKQGGKGSGGVNTASWVAYDCADQLENPTEENQYAMTLDITLLHPEKGKEKEHVPGFSIEYAWIGKDQKIHNVTLGTIKFNDKGEAVYEKPKPGPLDNKG